MIDRRLAIRAVTARASAHELLPPELGAQLDALTCSRLGLATLEVQGRDALDFHEVASWNIRDLVARAYARGVLDTLGSAAS